MIRLILLKVNLRAYPCKKRRKIVGEKAAQTVRNMFRMTFKNNEKPTEESGKIYENRFSLEDGKYFYIRSI